MRLTVCLEGNTEGRVLASVDMEEIVKMTITDDIEKSNFNPQMLKSCTDTSYQCGYEQGRADMAKETYSNLMSEISLLTSSDMSKENLYKFAHRVTEFAEQLKEHKK